MQKYYHCIVSNPALLDISLISVNLLCGARKEDFQTSIAWGRRLWQAPIS